MAEVPGKLCGPADAFTISGDSGGLLTVSPTAALVVRYTTGGMDTIPSDTAAAECPLDPAFVWVLYVVPGSGALHAVKEADLAAGTLTGDWTALAHVHQHQVVPHQPAGATAAGGGGGADPVAVKAYSMATPTSIADGAFLFVPFEHTEFDQGTAAAQHDDVTDPSHLICQADGIYQVTGLVLIASPSTSIGGAIGPGPINVRILRDDLLGNEEMLAEDVIFQRDVTGVDFAQSANPTAVCKLTSGDVVRLFIRNSTGVAIDMLANDTFDFGLLDKYPALGWARFPSPAPPAGSADYVVG